MTASDHSTITPAADQHQPALAGNGDATDLEVGDQAFSTLQNPALGEWVVNESADGTIETFDDWLKQEWGVPDDEHLRVLAKGVMTIIVEALKSPDVVARDDGDYHVLLSDGNSHDGTKSDHSHFISFVNGCLIREDRIYDAFPDREQDVREVLNRLGSMLIVRGAFRPSNRLQNAFLHAEKIAEKPKKATKSKNVSAGIPLAPHAACLAVAEGDFRATALLHQIRYWFDKARASFNGKRFIAKTAAEWAAETGLSLPQYNRAVRKLKDLGVIETEQHLFACRAQTFLRPITYLGLPAVALTPPPEQ
jgi:hypothetical protein